MLWIYLTFFATIIWSFVELFDKFVVDQEISSGGLAAAISSTPFFLLFILAGAISGNVSFAGGPAWAGFLAGIIYYAGLRTYYGGIQLEDVSRFIPTLSFSTVFIVITAYIFLGERFSIPVYAGVTSIVVGSILISMDHPLESLKSFQSKKGMALAVSAAILFASKDLIIKYLVSGTAFWSIIFWTGVGGLTYTVFSLILERENLVNQTSGYKHLAIIGVLNTLAYFSFAAALRTGPVSLASSLTKSASMFVFAGSLFLTKFHPDIIAEDIDRETLIQKLLATVLIITGVVAIQVLR